MSDAYGICTSNKCKREVYSKEQANTTFLKSENIAVITGTCPGADAPMVTVSLPSGFTYSNSTIIGIGFKALTTTYFGQNVPITISMAGSSSDVGDNMKIDFTNCEYNTTSYKYIIVVYRYK